MDTVIVDGETKLVPVKSEKGVTRFHEVYFNWETGSFHDFPSNLSANEVAEAFRQKRREAEGVRA